MIKAIYVVSNSNDDAIYTDRTAFTNEFDSVGYVMANAGFDTDLMPSEALRILRLNSMVTFRVRDMVTGITKKWKITRMLCRY